MSYAKEIKTRGNKINNLFAKEYEHPMDAVCLNALKMNSAFDSFTKFVLEYGLDRIQTIVHSGSQVIVTENNMPYLYNCVKDAAEILGVDMPVVYVKQDPYINAYTTNVKNPILCLSSSLTRYLNHEELMFVIGHELGHIKSEHIQYLTLGSCIPLLSAMVDIPIVGTILTSGLLVAFGEWKRCAEFTCDRAGLLVCQDLEAALSCTAKMGGYPVEFYDSIDIDGFLKQASDFKGLDDDTFNKLAKAYINLGNDHPWTVYRARELMLWCQAGEYSRVINRCSTWGVTHMVESEQRLVDLKAELDKLEASAETTRIKADMDWEEAEAAKQRSAEATGMAAITAKATEAFAEATARATEDSYAHILDRMDAIKKEMEQLATSIEDIRNGLSDVSAEYIQIHTAETLGNLTRVEE